MKIVLFIFCIVAVLSCTETPKKSPAASDKQPYSFPVSNGWKTETFELPISFAPTINYKGKEDIRFMPGFEKKDSADYWSYVFAWWLEGKQEFNQEKVNENLTAYYRGLVLSNIRDLNIARRDSITADVKETIVLNGDGKTFEGTVRMIDYGQFTAPFMLLHVVVHVRNCGEHTAVIYEVSPAAEGAVRNALRRTAESFTCNAK